MNDQATSPGCPDLETVSAAFDGELEPDETVRAHLGTCPECVRRLADYETIRGVLSRAVASEPDPGMNARIAAYVRAESAGTVSHLALKPAFSDSRTAWFLRVAALFLLGIFFVYLLTDQMHVNRANPGRLSTASAEPAWTSAPASLPSAHPAGALDAEPGAGDFVRARVVSNSPSERKYAIDIDPALIPAEFGGIPEDERIPVPFFGGTDDGAMRRIPLRGDAASDAMRMLELIRRDLTALDVPGVSVDTESRGSSLFTTIRLESAGMFDMSVTKTDGLFELFLMSGESPTDDGPVFLRFEFFCE
ncbi:MAG: zf-HC2 domain-containing protein [Lentisphaeria bacterium]|nr:zf-HC2 domain-containing protein [Lentisphaeria bacterium]